MSRAAVKQLQNGIEAHAFGSELARLAARARGNLAAAEDQCSKAGWRLTLWKLEDAIEHTKKMMAERVRPR